MLMMNSFSALRQYDIEIRFNRRDLYQTLAFCGHVFTTKLQLKKITLGHMTENKCGYQMHIFVTSFSTQYAPVWRCFCLVQPLRQPFRPKCTNRILQMHHQNPVVPSESGVHPQNPVCTYSVNVSRTIQRFDCGATAAPKNMYMYRNTTGASRDGNSSLNLNWRAAHAVASSCLSFL